MSNSVSLLWGTGVAPFGVALRRRVTSDGDVRVTSEGETRICDGAQIYVRITSQGDRRVTSQGDRRILSGFLGPASLGSSSASSDGAESFAFRYETNPFQPSAQGGENLFSWAYLTVSWSMGATLRVLPMVDQDDDSLALPDGSRIDTVRTTFTLEQQGGTLERQRRVIAVPLVRALIRDETEVSRWYLRGERIALTLESTGALGVGELMLEGIQLESEAVRKAIYTTVDT